MSFLKKNKKVIIFIGIVFVIISVSLVAIFLLLRKGEVEETFTEKTSEDYKEVVTKIVKNEVTEDELIKSEQNKPVVLSDFESGADQQKIFNEGEWYFFSRESNSILAIKEGEPRVMYQFEEEVIDVILSPDFKKAIIIPDLKNKIYINFENNEKKPLPDGIQSVAWSPDSNKIIYQYVNAFQRKNTLNIANPDGSDRKLVHDFEDTSPFLQNIDFTWYTPESVLFMFVATDPSGNVLNVLNLATGDISTLEIGNVYGYTTSKTGELLLYDQAVMVRNEEFYKVFVYNFENGEVFETGLETTAGKCVFETELKLICAVSQEFYSLEVPEVLIRYDLDSGQKEIITIPDTGAVVNYGRMGYSEGSLYYINNIDSKFYKLKIE